MAANHSTPSTGEPQASGLQGTGTMSVREAGRKGGDMRRQRLGRDGYSELGRQGVEALRAQRGPDAMSEIGREGGEVRKQVLGSRGYSELGRQGGQRVRELVEKGRQAEHRGD